MGATPYPFIRLTLALVCGILLGEYYIIGTESATYLLLFLLLYSSIYFWKARITRILKAASIKGTLTLGSFILLGWASVQFTAVEQRMARDQAVSNSFDVYLAEITSRPTTTKKSIRYKAEVKMIREPESWGNVSIPVLLYFIDVPDAKLEFGDQLLVKGSVVKVQSQTNPRAFDYSAYLAREGIYYQGFIRKGDFKVLKASTAFPVMKWTYWAGDYFDQILTSFFDQPRELNMIRAMSIGRRDELSPELREAYNTAGISHILAVSGLHVGIIYLLLALILTPIKRGKSRWIFYVLVLMGIWSYAFVSGSSPSVLRASFMITVYLLAVVFSRKSNPYNAIFISAFFLLLIKPSLLYSVSFQLSYMAVIGIIYLYPKIYGWLFIRNKVLDFFWKTSALSIAAQIATFPIALYYFHQFPVFFLFTNLLAIPMAIIMLNGSLILLLVSWIEPVAELVSAIMEFLAFCFNQLITWVSQLDLAAWSGVVVSKIDVVLIYILLATLILYVAKRRKELMWISALLVVLLTGINAIKEYRMHTQKVITCYNVNGKSAIDIFYGNRSYADLQRSSLSTDELQYNILPNRNYHSISDVTDWSEFELAKFLGKNVLMQIGPKTLVIVEDPTTAEKIKNLSHIDYLFVSKQGLKSLELLIASNTFQHLIFDSSIREREIQRLEEQIELPENLHAVCRDGAIQIII